MKTFKDLLDELDAYEEIITWAGDKTIEQVVEQCHRGDWLEWLALEVNIDKRKRVLVGGLCANTIRHLMKDERSLKAVDVAIAYGKGEASEKELEKARDAAYAAYAAAARDAARDARDAAYAAYAAAYAAAWDAARDAWDAAYAAYAAAYAAAWAAARDARDAAIENNQLQTANICREVMGEEIIEKVNKLLK